MTCEGTDYRDHPMALERRHVGTARKRFSGRHRLPGGGAAAVTSSEIRYPRIGLLGAAAARVTFDPPERVARSLPRQCASECFPPPAMPFETNAPGNLQYSFGRQRLPGGRAASRPGSEIRIPRIGLLGAAAARVIFPWFRNDPRGEARGRTVDHWRRGPE